MGRGSLRSVILWFSIVMLSSLHRLDVLSLPATSRETVDLRNVNELLRHKPNSHATPDPAAFEHPDSRSSSDLPPSITSCRRTTHLDGLRRHCVGTLRELRDRTIFSRRREHENSNDTSSCCSR